MKSRSKKSAGGSHFETGSFLSGVVLGSASDNSSGGVYTNCSPDDKSFYCTLARDEHIFSMILNILLSLMFIGYMLRYIFVPYLFGTKKARGKNG